MSPRPVRSLNRSRLMLGASAVAIFAANQPAAAAPNNPFARMADPSAAVAQAATAQATQSAAVNAASAQALANFAQASAARKAMDITQAAARAAAMAAASNIPNGLGAGGLQVAPGATPGSGLWIGANAPTQSTGANGRTAVNVQQTASQAILNWQTFNVGQQTDLSFAQQSSSWVVLNRVTGAGPNPTTILGTIKAPGTVLIMNQNGVIFGSASQVNVGALIAGAAQITDSQFQTNGIYSTQLNGQYVPSFTDAVGAVTVQPGAQITTNAPATVLNGGGYVMLLGGTVQNAGSITTPMGQTLLAAGDSFLLRQGFGTTANATSTTRGSEVATVIAAGSANGAVSNTGEIYAQQGDITLVGHDVTQAGVLLSTTSVNQRGTIHLLNAASDATGSVTLTGGSYTAILPELDSTDTALDSQRAALISDSATQNVDRGLASNAQFNDRGLLADREDESRVEIVTGGNVEFQGNSLTQAQGGQVAVSAANRIQVDTGATIDVSGVQNVAMNVADDEILVNVQGSVVADSPVNRDSGALFNSNVWVNAADLIYVPAGTGGDATARYYTKGGLFEVSGYLGNIGHTIGEWDASAGTITLSAKEVVAQTGSLFDIAGGSLAYQGGDVSQTLLKGADGQMYTADDAPANVLMLSVGDSYTISHDRWGSQYAQTWSSPFSQTTIETYVPSYVVGKDGGQLILSAPTAVFEGVIDADVISGVNQTSARPAGVTDPYLLAQNVAPLAGGLSIGQYNATGVAGAFTTDVQLGSNATAVADSLTLSSAVPTARVGTAWLDAGALSGFGLGDINIDTAGSLAIDAPISLANGGAFSAVGATVAVNADITAHGGSISLGNILTTAPLTSGGHVFEYTPPSGAAGVNVTVADGVALSTSGLWVNVPLDPKSQPDLAFVNGGSITIDTTQDITLGAGSVIDVSSGGGVLASGKTLGGTGGNVTLIAGDFAGNVTTGGVLTLDGTINGIGVNGGGTLTLSTPGNMLIGNNVVLSGGQLPAGQTAPLAVVLTQAMVIPAGQKLPFALTQSGDTLTLDQPLPVAITPQLTFSLVTAAPWVVPQGMIAFDLANGGFQSWGSGVMVPKNQLLTSFNGSFPAGSIVPSAVFPNGVPIQPYKFTLAAGSVQPTPTIYPVGTQIPAGVALPQTVSIMPAPSLGQAFFSAGFSNYDIIGGEGLLVAQGAAIAQTMPVYEFTAASLSVPTGEAPSSALPTWLPPLFLENPVTGKLTQRGGASLTLSSVYSTVKTQTGGSVVIADGASISVDPGQSINISAFGQVTIDGDLTAHGGAINLTNLANGATAAQMNVDASGVTLGTSIWLDPTAKLDVSGFAASALDQYGRPYGQAANGGSISLNGGEAFLIIRPGAELDADGTQVTIDPAAGAVTNRSGGALNVASNGGSISLSTAAAIYDDGNLHAFSGGQGGADGSLSISVLTPTFVTGEGVTVATATPSAFLTVVQSQPTPTLPDDIAPGTDLSDLAFGQTTISADAIKAGGFGTVSLSSRDYLEFSGDVSLALSQSLTLTSGAIISGTPVATMPSPTSAPVTGAVSLSAPYVLLTSPILGPNNGATGGAIETPTSGVALPTTATFEVNADQIDVQGGVIFSANVFFTAPTFHSEFAPGFKTVSLNSQGDIRFLAPDPTSSLSTTTLITPFDLDFTAAQLYPTTKAQVYIAAGSNGVGTISINRINDLDPATPSSVFGGIIFAAPTIEDAGVVTAPLGQVSFGGDGGGFHGAQGETTETLDLLPGSITSVSAAGLTIPYGGTSDGVNYDFNGAPIATIGLGQTTAPTITLLSGQVDVHSGAVVNLSGGGNLVGEAFIGGRGGSVNVLATPLVNANPAIGFSSASDQVYAIVPGYGSNYAPVDPEHGFGNPAIGQRITIPAGVPGLPAGTYTLLPSNYALLPGAFRVELGKTTSALSSGVSLIGDGTYLTAGYTGVANTGVKSALPSLLLITPAASVLDDSQFDQEGYSAFVSANATQFGAPLSQLPNDAGTLVFTLQTPTKPFEGSALIFQGSALLQGTTDPTTKTVGFGGTVEVTGSEFEIYGSAPTPGFAGVSIAAADLDALGAPRLIIGGTLNQGFGATQDILNLGGGGADLFIRSGVTLQAGELFLIGGNIDVGAGATLTTIGQPAAPYDSSDGYVYSTSSTVLALSNGVLDFVGNTGGRGAITIGAGASLFAGGTLGFATSGASMIDNTAQFGAPNIALSVGVINIGSSADIAAAGAPTGLQFDQALFDRLIAGDPSHGAPALQTLTLTASSSINIFGDASLDATGTGVNLSLTTPAIYGYGAAGDQAIISASKIAWNSVVGAAPPAVTVGGAGTGQGTLTLQANEIDLGQFTDLDSTTSSRAVYGFDTVNLVASSKIVSAGDTTLSVYQAPSATTGAVLGQSGVGGNLTLTTPLLTGIQLSTIGYTAGGALTVNTPTGVAPSTATSTVAGGEIDLSGASVDIDSSIVLPSGKLVVNAQNDVTLDAGSRIDVSGQRSQIESATVYGFGGDVILNSVAGGVTQVAGGVIDVSATQAAAGSITIGAGAGTVSLAGALDGAATTGFTSGGFTLTAGALTGFDALNAALTAGGVFEIRSFDIKTGDLTIDGGVKAQNVTVSVDGGDLTVTGLIDASGAAPGSISLAAIGGLTLAPTAVLDAHGTVLQVDGYNQPIEAENEAQVSLTATHGMLTLDSGATIDMSSPDGVARGQITLNASRTGETSGVVNVSAAGPVTITGAQSIAVNAFWTYAPTDPYGTIIQDNSDPNGDPVAAATGYVGMNQIDVRSQAFINAALSNPAALGQLSGLTSYTNAFHLRPGVEIDSNTPNGTLTVAGDLDLSGFRYASLNPNSQQLTSVYGSGEPGALVIRAGGDLDVVGSISDGFLPAPATSDDNAWLIQAGAQASSIESLIPTTIGGAPAGLPINSGTTFPNTAGLSLRYDIPIQGGTLAAGSVIPVKVTLSSPVTAPAGTRLTAAVFDSSGAVLYPAGTVLSTATTLPAGSQLAAGSVIPANVSITAMTWPAGTTLGDFTTSVTLASDIRVPFEGIIPLGSVVQMSNPTEPIRPTGPNGTQGSIFAVAGMLPAGDLSWSIELVAGADLGAADTRIVKPASLLKSLGVSGNLTLMDAHLHTVVDTPKYYTFTDYYNGNSYTYQGTRSYLLSISQIFCSSPGNSCTPFTYIGSGPTSISYGTTDPSVIRTGTGNLDLIAGGSFSEESLYGVYTAGTQSAPIVDSNNHNNYNNPLGLLFGAAAPDPTDAAADEAAYQAWYPEHGGNVLVSAQGDVTGDIGIENNTTRWEDTDLTSNWLFRQGGGTLASDPTAWSINFGIYAQTNSFANDTTIIGFQGIGTLGGGNLTVIAGHNAGVSKTRNDFSSGLDLAVGSTGRVLPDGTLVQTGGGALSLTVGGVLNPDPATSNPSIAGGDYFGSVTDLRGDITIKAGAVGDISQLEFGANFTSLDPRTLPFGVFKTSQYTPGPVVTPGDGTVVVDSRGDLVFGGAGDAGMEQSLNLAGVSYNLINADGSTTFVSGGGLSSFTLWTPKTSISVFSAGGDAEALPGTVIQNATSNGDTGFYPGTLSVIAANGDIRLLGPTNAQGAASTLELIPAPDGQLEMLASGSIYGQGQVVAMSGASMSSLATPFQPVFDEAVQGGGASNASPSSPRLGGNKEGDENPIAFGPDTPTDDLHAGDTQPALIYAGVDIDDLTLGQIVVPNADIFFQPTPTTWYVAAKAFNVVAGRDIIGTGTTPDVFVNNDKNDITLFQAGRDIIYQSITVAGPGLLDVQAGRNLYEGALGQLVSVGPLYGVDPTNPSTGAGITVAAGVGPNGPDYTAFAELYFNAANQLPTPQTPLAGSGEAFHAYDQELLTWLQQRFGYTGTSAGALAYFLALPTDQQGVFVRQVYYEELDAGGKEFNDPTSPLFKSYLRGREAIDTLFPTADAQGQPITYTGTITMFSGLVKQAFGPAVVDNSGISTDFGGDIQILNPGGQTILGVEGVVPGAGAGVLTQGTGDVDIFSDGSILLGESRILTTFGGNILAWSSTGDINAGRGSKTTVLITPPRRIYDDYGAVTLSPTVPSTGAGIGTLNPIPEIPPGNIDLIAPLGTVDAGEAGIRVSGNLNIAALHVVNAANIQVQGTATGLPQAVAVNTGALTAASGAGAAVSQIAMQMAQRTPPPPPEAPIVLSVRFLGFGDQ